MNKFLRKILAPLPGLVRWYLSKKRSYRYEDLTIEVLPGVFHPGLFFSTKMLLRYIAGQSLKGTAVLELGAGSGIISLLSASMGAYVTSTDISELAVSNIRLNANKTTLIIILSDLFDNIPLQKFDWIFINPPYYAKDPLHAEDYAWYCGTQHEYFVKLFNQLPPYIIPSTRVMMVLSEVCDLETIFKIALQHKFEFLLQEERRVWVDGKNYIFQIKQVA